jgi:hypothetical protein
MPTLTECQALQQTNTFFPSLSCMWGSWFGYSLPTVGVAPAPSQAVWTTPPATGVDAQATVDSLLNDQLVAQQNVNASNVGSTWLDTVFGGASNYINTPSMLGVLVIVGVLGFAYIGGSSPRRYGR